MPGEEARFPPRSILCATDLSAPSDEAVREAAAIAGATGARLVVYHVVALPPPVVGPPLVAVPPEPAVVQDLTAVRQRLDDQVGRLAPATANVPEVRVASEATHVEIVEKARSMSADLVVVGSHGRSGIARMLLGSVAEKVVRHAPCPVLVARPSPPSGHVLVATDLSDRSPAALRAAAVVARRHGATLTALHCLDVPPETMGLGGGPMVPVPPEHPESRPAIRRAAQSRLTGLLEASDVNAAVLIVDGPPSATIVRVAGELPAELVVVGATGKTGLARAILGSVAESVIRKAGCSVLAVRERA